MSLLYIGSTSSLVKSKGYWSNREVYFNLTKDQIIVNNQCSFQQIKDELALLHHKIITTNTFREYFLKWIDKNYLGAFKIEAILGKFNTNWIELQKELHDKRYTKKKISDFIAKHWWEEFSTKILTGIDQKKIHRIPRELSPLLLDFENLSSTSVEEYILKIAQLAQVPTKYPLSQRGSVQLTAQNKRSIFLQEITAENRLLAEWACPYLRYTDNLKLYYHGLISAINAAQITIAWLTARKLIITPLNLIQENKLIIEFKAWPASQLHTKLPQPLKSGLLKTIASSTMCSIEDIPSDLYRLLKPAHLPSNFYKELAKFLDTPKIKANRPPFPVDKLLPINNKTTPKKAWTPEWIRNNYNGEWYDFATIYWLHDASDQHKINTLRVFLTWACDERKFDSPWDITTTDIRNPHRPNVNGTYFRYLKGLNTQDKSTRWSSTATLFRIVCQYAQLPDSPVAFHGELQNPFKPLNNPFTKKHTKRNKTHRSSIPAEIHELMINIILSPDSEGFPTFQWAKQYLSDSNLDFVDVIDPENPSKQIRTWCPSRTTCLAVLLLSPLRKVQARWLDQGLMDREYYDITTKTMVPNSHFLKDFQYPNKNSHYQQYGRDSGVLQISSEILTREQALSIYVNTNKTQLWDNQRKSGYLMPWPDGDSLIQSQNHELRTQGQWLARLYRVFHFQRDWMEKYDPNPHPISFYHSAEDKDRVSDNEIIKDSLPWFVPIFRDLDMSKLVSYEIHGKTVRGNMPVSQNKLSILYNQLVLETEKRWNATHSTHIYLTCKNDKTNTVSSRFDLHSLRVTWVSRLFEMGIPVPLISEYIVGHATQLMTCLYLKIHPAAVRESIIEASQNADHPNFFSQLNDKHIIAHDLSEHLVNTQSTKINDLLPDNFVAFVPVDGGLCPMGGEGTICNEGYLDNSTEDGQTSIRRSGCGNCRFFLTGPDFTVQQLYACNALMIKMRSLGKEQKQLYNQIDEIKWQIEDLQSKDQNQIFSLESQKATLLNKINSYNETISPLIQEWFNRHELLQMSNELLHNQIDKEANKLVLVGSHNLTLEDYSIESQETTEFELVRATIEQARIITRQGFAMPEEPSRMLREFMSIILDQSPCQNLITRISDPIYATEVSSVLAGFLADNFDSSDIQKCIDNRNALPISTNQRDQLQNFMNNAYKRSVNVNKALPSLLPSEDN